MFGQKRKKNYFALLFYDREVQLVQVSPKGKLVVATALELPEGLIERGRIKDQAKLTEHLKALLLKTKTKTKFVVVGLPEVVSFSRIISIPAMETEEMDDAVRWEVESLLPMPIGEAYLDWMELGRTESGVQALVMALPMNVVDEYASILEGLGYQLASFEPASLSLARLATPGLGDQLVVEIGKREASLVIVSEKGGILLSSTVNYDESRLEGEVLETIQNTFGFYQRRSGKDKEVNLAKVWICGRAANQSLVGKIKEKLNIETSLVALKDPSLASAVSLARADVAAPRDEKTINLIPSRIQNIYDQAEKRRITSGWLKFWLFGLFIAVFGMGVIAAKLYFESKLIEGKIIEAQAKAVGQSSPVASQATKLQGQANRVLAVFDSRPQPAETWRIIKEAKNSRIEILHFAYNFASGEITLNGRAESRADLVDFREKLEATGRFSLVRVPLSSLEKERYAEFTVTLVE